MTFKNLDKCDNAKSGQVAKSWAKTSANVNRDARKLNGWHCLLLPINFFSEVKVKLPSICCPTLQWMDLKIKLVIIQWNSYQSIIDKRKNTEDKKKITAVHWRRI